MATPHHHPLGCLLFPLGHRNHLRQRKTVWGLKKSHSFVHEVLCDYESDSTGMSHHFFFSVTHSRCTVCRLLIITVFMWVMIWRSWVKYKLKMSVHKKTAQRIHTHAVTYTHTQSPLLCLYVLFYVCSSTIKSCWSSSLFRQVNFFSVLRDFENKIHIYRTPTELEYWRSPSPLALSPVCKTLEFGRRGSCVVHAELLNLNDWMGEIAQVCLWTSVENPFQHWNSFLRNASRRLYETPSVCVKWKNLRSPIAATCTNIMIKLSVIKDMKRMRVCKL